MLNKGFRYYFQTVLKTYEITDKEKQKEIIVNGFDENDEKYEEDIQKAYQQLLHLQETWNYINKAYELATQHFDTWQEFSKSYIIGRGMWGGTECANEGIMSTAEELLKNEKSPWKQMNFK